jgi:hypothetical protein
VSPKGSRDIRCMGRWSNSHSHCSLFCQMASTVRSGLPSIPRRADSEMPVRSSHGWLRLPGDARVPCGRRLPMARARAWQKMLPLPKLARFAGSRPYFNLPQSLRLRQSNAGLGESLSGPGGVKRTCPCVRRMSAFGGKADIKPTPPYFLRCDAYRL